MTVVRSAVLVVSVALGCATSDEGPVDAGLAPRTTVEVACARESGTYVGKVTAVYDGDTLTVDIFVGLGVVLRGQRLRLLGVDTPEVRGSSRPDGLAVRDRVREWVLDREVVLVMDGSRGKYGRWLGDVEVDGRFLSVWLLENGLARRINY